MIQHLENEHIAVAISTFGAEVQSVINKSTGFEYLWDGRPEFWKRRSPVLFPIVGSVWNGVFRMDGIEYRLGQHGFARDMEFMPVSDTQNELWFALEANDETMAKYPRRFRLEIGYRLDDTALTVMWRVKNCDNKPMQFQIGAHPALMMPDFNAADPIHGYITFDNTDLRSEVLNPNGSIGEGLWSVSLDGQGRLPLGPHTFECGTYIFGDSQLREATLCDKSCKPVVRFAFDTPYLGIWSPKPEAPFVCIEPWYGRGDKEGYTGDFADRTAVRTLNAGQTFSASYTMTFC